MALRYAVASGNWSNTATWDGGTLPTSADDVYADGKTVTCDINFTVNSINVSQRAGGINGGIFQVTTTSGLTLTATNGWYGTPTIATNFLMYVSISSGQTLNLIGNFFTGNSGPSGTNSGYGIYKIGLGTVNVIGNIVANYSLGQIYSCVNTGGGTFNLTGNITGGTGNLAYGIQNLSTSVVNINGIVTGGGGNGVFNNSSANNSLTITGACVSGGTSAVQNNTTGTVVINGTQTAVGNNAVYSIVNSSTGIITINGDILGALSSAPSTAYIVNNGLTGIVNINGNVTARSVSPSTSVGIVNNSGTGTMNIVGNVTGGSVANTIAINNGSLGTLNVTGNITGGSHATNTPAILSGTNASINNITGNATAGLYPALISPSFTATNIITGNIVNVAGVPAYNAYKLKISPSNAQQFTFQDTSNNNRVMATSNISPNVPIQANVRLGIVYGSTGEFTGTMAVPTPSNVRIGVSTDATTGTGELTAADFLNAILASSNAAAIRLKNVSTVNITGNQLASY